MPGVLGPVDGLQLQRVKWTDRGLQAFGGDVEIAGGGADIGVAQEHLNGAQVGASIQQMSGVGCGYYAACGIMQSIFSPAARP